MREDVIRHPVVVGVDGSDASGHAVEWAAEEAFRRGEPLRLVHAFVWPLLRIPPVLCSMGPSGGLRSHAQELLDTAARRARKVAPGVDVQTSMQSAFPVELMVAESGRASCVVVGSRGLGSVGRLLAGSTASELVASSRAPVVVVPGAPEPDRVAAPVVAAVDGSPHAAAALEHAVEVAHRRGCRLLVVHVGDDPAVGARVVADGVGAWREKDPDLEVVEEVRSGHPAGALVDLSRRASLIVVGSRGRGGFAGMVLGSVSQSLLHHSHCPVMVVPRSASGTRDSEQGNSRD